MEIYLQRRHALMIEDGAFSHYFKVSLNHERYPNNITGKKVKVILVNMPLFSLFQRIISDHVTI